MYCQNRVIHRIQEGDSLYKLARQYHTTVTELILLNSGVNPYNLQVGKKITICPGEGYEAPDGMMTPENPGTGNSNPMTPQNPAAGNNNPMTPQNPAAGNNNPMMPQNPATGNSNPMTPQNPAAGNDNPMAPENGNNGRSEWKEAMRLAWLNHVVWTRLYLISAAEDLANFEDTKLQLLKNVEEITDVFANNYSAAAIQQLKMLLNEHIRIAGQMIDALKKEDLESYNRLLPDWYENADRIAEFLSSQTPAYNEQELRNMFQNHLDLTRTEIEQWFNGEYRRDVEAFLNAENEMLSMADYLAMGLLAR